MKNSMKKLKSIFEKTDLGKNQLRWPSSRNKNEKDEEKGAVSEEVFSVLNYAE